MGWFKQLSCDHQWVVVKEERIPSPHERQLRTIRELGATKWSMGTVPEDAFFDTYILILRCPLCGKLDKTVRKV